MIRLAMALALLWTALSPALANDHDDCFKLSGDPAIEACNRVINSGRATKRQLADAYINRAQEWFLKKDYERTISDTTSALRQNDKLPLAYGNRGNAHMELKKYTEAANDYSAAIRLDPLFPAAYTGRGLALEKLGQRDAAIADFKKALTLKEKYQDTKWAHDTARARLRALDQGT